MISGGLSANQGIKIAGKDTEAETAMV